MKLSADRDGNIRRFSAKLGLREKFDPKEIDMLSAGTVPQLIPPVAVQGRKNDVLQFDISAYSTLEFYLSCILSREQFAELLLQCLDVFRRMQQVYLNYKNLVFDFDKIYMSLQDRTIHFIYLPLMNSKREADMAKFFQRVIQTAARSTYEQSSFLDACMAWLSKPGSFVVSEFESFVRAYNWGTATQTQASNHPLPQPQATPVLQVYQPRPDNWGVQTAGFSQSDTSRLDQSRQGGTTLLEADFLQPAPMSRFYLVRVSTQEKVELSRFPFLVGSEIGSVSYHVAGNAAVSRRHAVFSVQDGKCFITDQRSTNKTYLNNAALPPDTPQPLQNGDRVRMANEEFIFVQEG